VPCRTAEPELIKPIWDTERRNVAALLRDLIPQPFARKRVRISTKWQTSTVLSLAQTIYDQRQFESMPILGDALEDSGCNNAEILTHCRQPGEHVRGCWVVDLILEKA
jgi:hypothetical protein